jgi:hypothetical protein
MKCPYQHICRATATRVDHTQLTAKMNVDIIREDVEKDQTITIKQVRALIRKFYPGVNPKYNKLWRGKEITVSYVYDSWSGSYALLPRLFECNCFIKIRKQGLNPIRSTTTIRCTSIHMCSVSFCSVHRSILLFMASYHHRCITLLWEI